MSPEPPRYFTTMYTVLGTAYPSSVYEAGELATRPTERWSLEDGLCKGPIPVDDAFDYYTLGAKLSSPVRIKRSEPHGDGPLQLVDDYSDDGMRAPIGLSERKTGVCRTLESANAELVDCVPDDSALASYFHDGACSEPIMTVVGSTFPAIAGTQRPHRLLDVLPARRRASGPAAVSVHRRRVQ